VSLNLQTKKKSNESDKSDRSKPSSAQGSTGDRVFASPLARRLAAEKGIDLGQVEGTGPNRRIVEADILEFSGPSTSTKKATPSQVKDKEGAYVDIPHSNVRKVIASRLTQSKQQIPHYYLSIDVNVDALIKLREDLNTRLSASSKEKEKGKLSVNDFLVKASALALKDFPALNSSWQDTAVRQYRYVDINVAVSTDSGLVTPFIKDADIKGLSAISQETKTLATKAREGKLSPHEYQGGTFTISNLGMFGVNNFSAIINPPQSAILAVGTTTKRLVPNEKDTTGEHPYKVVSVMSVTLSCDHRVVDGAVGAQWLQKFKVYLEDPITMLL